MTAEEECRIRTTIEGFLTTLVDKAINELKDKDGNERSAERAKSRSSTPLQR